MMHRFLSRSDLGASRSHTGKECAAHSVRVSHRLTPTGTLIRFRVAQSGWMISSLRHPKAAIYETQDSGYYGGYRYRYGDPPPASGFLARLKEGLESVSQRSFRRAPVTPQPLGPAIVKPTPSPPDISSQNIASCVECGKNFDAARSDARFCSSACRQKAYRARKTRQTA